MSGLEDYVRTTEDLAALHLRRPYAVIAFGGWIDASFAATNAVRYLADQLTAPRIAELDPELFYNFTDTRPRVVVRGGGEREVRWRRARWYTIRTPDDGDHDLVLFIAPEPNLRWRTFSSVLLDLFQTLGTEALLLIGAVLAPTYHRARVPMRGWATTDDWRSALARRGVATSTYEGPTGIATIVALGAAERGLPAMSLNAMTPSYLANTANPRTTLELLRVVADLYAVKLPLRDLERTVRSFNTQVDQILASQPELRAEIEQLARAAEDEPDPDPRSLEGGPSQGRSGGELPSSAEVLRDLEDYLKHFRETPGESTGDT
jgi:proteasome assembly chaperone (PAC2) family protein